MQTHFDVLYGKDKNNKVKKWEIRVEKYDNYSEIIILHGYNKLIESRKKISNGKNIGKSNETNHYTQAILEAKSKWNKKYDLENYKTNINDITNDITQNPYPMLANDYKKQIKKIIFPCFIQRKFDGFRMIYNTSNDIITTRQGKEFLIVKESGKLYEELKKLPKGYIIDGELYSNKINFESLGVLRKTKKLSKDDYQNLSNIEYHIYDIVDVNKTFEQRNLIIKHFFNTQYEKIKYVETYEVKNEKEIKKYHEKFLEEGYEGTMIRNKNGLYKPEYRSMDLLKYKDFNDSEFKIVDFTFEKDVSGKNEDLIVWIVEIKPNILCKVRPKGTKEERQSLYKECQTNFNKFKNRNLWVKFFSYTSDGNLRFPTTLRDSYKEYIRDSIL